MITAIKNYAIAFLAITITLMGCAQNSKPITNDTNNTIPQDSLQTNTVDSNTQIDTIREIYDDMHLSDEINYTAFQMAMKGYSSIHPGNNGILTLIDFSKPSNQERFYVIDLKNKSIRYKTYVSHGRNSGNNMATQFSNIPGSYKSSLGFYLTDQTYYGSKGYSLRLKGLEKGINDKAYDRAIVVHGADYANPSVLKNQERLGRSLGCPALPTNLSKDIINTIKDGSVLFIYADNSDYINKSTLIS